MRRRPTLDKARLTKLSRVVLVARRAWREAPIGAERDRLYEAYMDARGQLAWTVISDLIPLEEVNASDGRSLAELELEAVAS